MSDFDKEAEREKLREKFAKDEQKRERTSRMSELLLKGATMTNKHHDCGSPIFRWEGEEFCPTCQGTPDGEGVAEGEGTAEGEGEESRAPAEGTTVDVGTPAEDASTASKAGTPSPAPETTNGTPEAATPTPDRSTASSGDAGTQSPPPTERRPPATAGTGAEGTTDSPGDLAAARASLTRTLTSLAERAEATEDLSKRRDLLAAVEDAADALEATKRADR